MAPFRDFPIRRKLAVIILVGVLIAVLVSSLAILAYDRNQFRSDMTQEISVLARITAQRSSAALMFRDKKALLGNLESLLLKDSIEKICVHDAQGVLVAQVARQTRGEETCIGGLTPDDGVQFLPGLVQVASSIDVHGKPQGILLVEANLDALEQRSIQFMLVSLVLSLVAALVAYLVTRRLTRVISTPITELTAIASHIRLHGDYSVRAKAVGRDETGALVHIFNEMVSEIQQTQMRMSELVMELKEKSSVTEAHAEKMAKRHDAIRDFFSGVSHDLRQPLQAIDMYVNVLQGNPSEGDRRLIHHRLQQAVTSLGNLFRELLDVARFEAKVEQDVVSEPVVIGDILRQVAHEFEALTADKGIGFRFRPKNCQVLSEATMLERIVRNLVSNAVRYTDRGGILLNVRLRKKEAWIEVWDTGRGIPPDKLQSIFSQFVQVQEKDAEKGHGLGLSIVKRLANSLGHGLEVHSRVGRGTVFRLRLSRVEEPLIARKVKPDAEKVANAPSPVGVAPAGVEPISTILVIDDDRLVLEAVTTLLASWGMKTISLDSAQSARAWAANHPLVPSLVISDFHLGSEDLGSDVIRDIRELLGEKVPAFIISGAATAEDHETIKAAGLQLLPKPVKPARLRAMIQYALTQGSSAQS